MKSKEIKNFKSDFEEMRECGYMPDTLFVKLFMKEAEKAHHNWLHKVYCKIVGKYAN